MKKIGCLLLVISFSFLCLFTNASAKELTLDELEAQAKANRKAYNEAKSQKALTEEERDKATAEKAEVESQISSLNKELEDIEKEIKSLQESIETKDDEIKEIMKFVQVSNGESAYLEYAFGASSFTDFIYRVSVAEQLSDYNDTLIKEYNADVKELGTKQTELTSKQAELSKKQQELTILEAQLNQEIETLQSGMISKDQEYKTQISLINSMKQRGCSGSDTVSSCQNRISSSGNLTSVNGTYMPISRGYVTSDYGWRSYGGGENHTGIDFSNSTAGDAVYPIADGQVILLDYNPSCGNHIVYVKHNINGHSYITSYWHLSSWSVSVGQHVSYTTRIGSMAGRNTGDQCSGGIHVHLNLFDNAGNSWENRVANGGNPNSGRINPRTVAPQIPSEGAYFSHR